MVALVTPGWETIWAKCEGVCIFSGCTQRSNCSGTWKAYNAMACSIKKGNNDDFMRFEASFRDLQGWVWGSHIEMGDFLLLRLKRCLHLRWTELPQMEFDQIIMVWRTIYLCLPVSPTAFDTTHPSPSCCGSFGIMRTYSKNYNYIFTYTYIHM